jgi:hypothetical protein
MSMRWLTSALILLLAACASAQPDLVRVQSNSVENLYLFNGKEGHASLLSDTRGRFDIEGRCLLLRFDERSYTPLFLRVGEPPSVRRASIFVYSRHFPIGELLSMPGLIPSQVRLPGGQCPRDTIIVPSINSPAD